MLPRTSMAAYYSEHRIAVFILQRGEGGGRGCLCPIGCSQSLGSGTELFVCLGFRGFLGGDGFGAEASGFGTTGNRIPTETTHDGASVYRCEAVSATHP